MKYEELSMSKICMDNWNKNEDLEAPFHRHIDRLWGMSSPRACKYSTSRIKVDTNIKIVENSGSENGALIVGRWIHERVQKAMNEYMKDNPIEGYIGSDEVYSFAPITKLSYEKVYEYLVDHGFNYEYPSDLTDPYDIIQYWMIVYTEEFRKYFEIFVSPIDYAIITGNQFIIVYFPFKDGLKEIKCKPPHAKWLRIWDIKSAGNFGFYKMHSEGLLGGSKYGWQFTAYMHATQLTVISLCDVHKAKLRPFDLDLEYNPQIWYNIVEAMTRKSELVKLMRDNLDVDKSLLLPTDFECVNGSFDDMTWWSCPWSNTRDEFLGTGEPKLKLTKPCPNAVRFIKENFKISHVIGNKFFRGKSHVTIMEYPLSTKTLSRTIEGDNIKKEYNLSHAKNKKLTLPKNISDYRLDELVVSENKSGTQYVDIIYYAKKWNKRD